MSVSSDLEAWIRTARQLRGFGSEVAPEVARVIKEDLEDSIQAGESPAGDKWKLTLEGKQPLQHAAQALRVAAFKGTIFVRLRGPEARHHRGTARGRIVRQVIPNSPRIPERMAAKIRRTLEAQWTKAVGGGA